MAITLVSCSSSGGGDDNPVTPNPPTGGTDDDEPEIPEPSPASLVFPEDNTECTTGIVNPDDDTQSTITFEWNAGANTDRYTVTVTNINTGASRFSNSETTSVDISLERGQPYTWYVTSRANGNTTTVDSESFQFYSEGPGIENYAPFPAEVVSPARGASLATTSSVNLSWSGSDIDDDISAYVVTIDTSADLNADSLAPTSETSIDVPVASGNVYYWKVITIDERGNTSDSEIFEFRVN